MTTNFRPTLHPLPPDLVRLTDHARHAQAGLTPAVWDWLDGGAADEITLRANRQAWDGLTLWPRVLRPLAGGHTQVTLLGRRLAHPILVAPMATQCAVHPEGELATACAAAALGAGLVLSLQTSTPIQTVADAMAGDPGRGPLWMQLYAQHDRAWLRDQIQQAEAAGCEALVLTVDAPCSGARDRERRAGFRLPPGVRAVQFANCPPPPRPALAPDQSALFDDLLQQAPTWDNLAWLQSQTRLPLLLKGVLHPDDARQALRLGVAGLVVSNHGGRTLDTAPATARALPRIVQAVEGAIPVLVDGGIRRGTDVLKAMALGASAVLVGRPVLWGLAHAGAAGVAHVLRVLRDELEIAMALTGCATLDQACPALLEG